MFHNQVGLRIRSKHESMCTGFDESHSTIERLGRFVMLPYAEPQRLLAMCRRELLCRTHEPGSQTVTFEIRKHVESLDFGMVVRHTLRLRRAEIDLHIPCRHTIHRCDEKRLQRVCQLLAQHLGGEPWAI